MQNNRVKHKKKKCCFLYSKNSTLHSEGMWGKHAKVITNDNLHEVSTS